MPEQPYALVIAPEVEGLGEYIECITRIAELKVEMDALAKKAASIEIKVRARPLPR